MHGFWNACPIILNYFLSFLYFNFVCMCVTICMHDYMYALCTNVCEMSLWCLCVWYACTYVCIHLWLQTSQRRALGIPIIYHSPFSFEARYLAEAGAFVFFCLASSYSASSNLPFSVHSPQAWTCRGAIDHIQLLSRNWDVSCHLPACELNTFNHWAITWAPKYFFFF